MIWPVKSWMGCALEASQPLSSFSSSGHFPGSQGGSFGGGSGLALDEDEDGELLLEEDELLELDELDELLELEGLDELELLGVLLEELDHWLDDDSEDCEELEFDGLEEDDEEEDITAYFPIKFENATNGGGVVNARYCAENR